MSARGKRELQGKAHLRRAAEKERRRRARRAAFRPATGVAAALALGIAGVGPARAADERGAADRRGSQAEPAERATPAASASALGAEVNGKLFFEYIDDAGATQLWTSDGTTVGTVLVRTIDPSGGGLNDMTPIGNTVYFVADDGTNGPELWKSNGTPAGTVLVKAIDPSDESYSGPGNLTAAGGKLFFTADDGETGTELWTSDGTVLGTKLVADIDPDASSGPTNLTAVGSEVFFAADDGGGFGRELWSSDGTGLGTVLVANVNPGPEPYGEELYPYSSYPGELTNVGGVLYFTADDGSRGRELWKSNGTEVGTVLVEDINPSDPYGYYAPQQLTASGGILYFTADDGTRGRELWRSDGTANNTFLLRDMNPGDYSYVSDYTPEALTDVGGTLYFTADDGTTGRELWMSDGTIPDGTVQVEDIRGGFDSSYPSYLTATTSRLFFTANDGVNGQELWSSTGTAAGTAIARDIVPGPESTAPYSLTGVGGTLFFKILDATTSQYELWKSDGTSAGTVRLKSDFVAPDTTISAGPAAGSTITTSSATFSFAGTPGDTATLQCSLDGAPFTGCTSPKAFTGLSNGSHTVAFRAVDGAGNVDATPVSRTFTVKVAPSNAFTLPATGKANTRKATLTLTVALPGRGVLALKPVGRAPVTVAKKSTTSAGKVKLKIKLTKAGLAKIKAKRSGKLKVKVAVTFTPTGGVARTLTKKYTLIYKK